MLIFKKVKNFDKSTKLTNKKIEDLNKKIKCNLMF